MAAGTRMSLISSGKKWESEVAFSQCFRCEAGPLLYLSGQVSIDAAGQVVGPGDLTLQTRTTFNNIRDLLAVAGSTMEDVVKLTYFVTDMGRWPEVQKVRAEFFPRHHPASTTVEVSRLFKKEYLIEIEAVAVAH
jgi:2-iminobutanoate/2-iminopropanoate deaminase